MFLGAIAQNLTILTEDGFKPGRVPGETDDENISGLLHLGIGCDNLSNFEAK